MREPIFIKSSGSPVVFGRAYVIRLQARNEYDWLREHGTLLPDKPTKPPPAGYMYVLHGEETGYFPANAVWTALAFEVKPFLWRSAWKEWRDMGLVPEVLNRTWYEVPKGLICVVSDCPFA